MSESEASQRSECDERVDVKLEDLDFLKTIGTGMMTCFLPINLYDLCHKRVLRNSQVMQRQEIRKNICSQNNVSR